jgi:hypothetical protein
MSISSILSSLTGTSHAAFSTQSATSTASEELQKLFSKLHMDAIASSATSSTTSVTSTDATSTTSSSGGVVTDLVHSLRHILDGGIAVAKEARTATKTATSAYTHGGGLGALATQVIDKLG